MKIVCAGICKNESHNIPLLLENLIDFGITELYIVDTGSTDNSVSLFKNSEKVKVIIKEVLIEPFNFSIAKNYLIDMILEDTDFVIHLDMDERIKSLPGNLEIGKGYSGDREEILYGMVSKYMHKMSPRIGWKWEYPIHECIRHTYEIIYSQDFVISHYQKPDKDCYESLTELYFESDPERLYFHRLTDLIHNSECEEFVKLFKKYGTWTLADQQKWLAVKNYQSSLLVLGLPADPIFFNILIEANSSSSWFYLFLCYDSIGEYKKAFKFLNEALEGNFPKENEIKFFNKYVKERALKLARSKKDLYNIV